VRVTASITFICVRLVWMALVIYAASKVLVSVTGCDLKWLPLIAAGIGLIATLYTLAGGIEAVMTTAVLQFGLLLLGAILMISLITLYAGGLGVWWPRQAPGHWMPQPFFSADPAVRLTVVGTFISYFISTVCAGGSDQVAIQRYLTTRDAAAARRAVMFGHMSVGVVMLSLGFVGAALLGYFTLHPELLPPGKTLAQAGDGLFPYFLGHGLPPGVSGLVVAGLLRQAGGRGVSQQTIEGLPSGVHRGQGQHLFQARAPGRPAGRVGIERERRAQQIGLGVSARLLSIRRLCQQM